MGMIANGELGLSVRTAINNIALGHIRGVYPVYTDTTHVAIQPGQVECNSNTYILTTAVAHEILNFSSGGFTYLYIDDSESTKGGTPTIIDSTTEPAWSDSKQGYYNGNDRCIGALYCDGAATLSEFVVVARGRSLRFSYDYRIQIASNMNPDSTWQTPDDMESSTKLPVSAISGCFQILGADANSSGAAYLTPYSLAKGVSFSAEAIQWTLGANETFGCIDWVDLDSTRNVRIAGNNDDDNTLSCWIKGYEIRR